MQLRTMSLARGDEGPHVLRKAGAAEADAGHQEPGVYPRVQAQAAVNLVIRDAERLAHVREFVREGDLGREERVRRVLDCLCGANRGDEDWTLGKLVESFQDARRRGAVHAQHDAVGR